MRIQCIVGIVREKVSENRHKEYQEDIGPTEQGGRVSAQPTPGLCARPDRLLQGYARSGGNSLWNSAHAESFLPWERTRGSITPYKTSTSRLTRMKMTATSSAMP